ncbi:hypothetical protein E4K67_14820 [Desulfosporosinus fructosivorans]|uniref:Uncharacterized protein n=1 Tax=Desulfosporosinus fructosivorans TaxID=2018669 RepID=A0A4Z0R4R4_9FIRM|nr:hypothetical protein E4K67_14820 [Desulfosporosinus fructosivorans]
MLCEKREIRLEYGLGFEVKSPLKELKRRLVTKEIKFVFVVDIYNEGIDIPEVPEFVLKETVKVCAGLCRSRGVYPLSFGSAVKKCPAT